MATSLIFSVIFTLCGVSLVSSKKLTDEQLRVIYETPVDVEEFTSNIFTLQAPQQLYVYEYLRDLLRNVEESTKMAKFVQASLKRLQQKIDDFNQEHKLEKVTVKKFLLKRIYLQLNGPYKKPDTGKTTTGPRPSSEKSTPTDPAPMKNTSTVETDPKSGLKDLKEPKSNQEKVTQKSHLANDLNSSAEKKSPTKKQTVANPPSTSKVSDGKLPPLSTSTPISQRIQPPLPTNPPNFTMRFDKWKSTKLEKFPSKSEPTSSKPIKQSSGMKESISKPFPAPTVNPSKPTKPIEMATPSKKPTNQAQSQNEKSSNSELSNRRQASRKMQNASSTAAIEGGFSLPL